MVSKILVPTDGSKASRKAAAFAVDLAKQLNASIIALTVIDKRLFVSQVVPASKTPRHINEVAEDYLQEIAGDFVAEIKQMCEKKGVAVKQVIKMGYPAEEIVNEAKKVKANMIVMGSRGRSALSATVLGSVSYAVLHDDKSIPVLTVRG